MLSMQVSNAARDIALGLMNRKIIGIDLEKHLKSSAGKYNLDFDSDNEYLEFENKVFKYMQTKNFDEQRIFEISKAQRDRAILAYVGPIYVKNVISNKIHKCKNSKEASKLTGIEARRVRKYVKDKILYKGVYLFSHTQVFKCERKASAQVKVTNIETGEEFTLKSKSEAAKFIGSGTASITQGCRCGYTVAKKWKVKEIGVC